ncbi:replication initiation factor domain-containing protein [Methylotenera sp.]|uniref:replication initiation factor domain-containing protein n=1 Tax=Methylotenera sp. TaxID=2051956 RepID=UPI0027327D08|nr:replication initiation factor domain-containing protein [Methylotenera sp.]MDP3308608.1 replication initiation factor domain-containing protein [Methylotenera sp.]
MTPPTSSPRITTGRCGGAFIHWLSVKFSCVDDAAFLKDFLEVSGLTPETKKKVTRKVLADYDALCGQCITNNNSLLLTTNDSTSKVLVISGSDCLNISNWDSLKIFLSSLPNTLIARIDIAIDVDDDLTLDDIIEAHRQGTFTVKGKIPTILPIGNFVNDDGIQARTVNIGQRVNGKMLRCYEIGRKLKINPPTTIRLEVEFKCAKTRTISFDSLVDPLPYFCGAYPYLSQFGKGYTKFTDIHAKEKLHDYSSKVKSAQIAYGQLISLMMEVEGSASKVIKLLIRHGYPAGLTPDQVQRLSLEIIKNEKKVSFQHANEKILHQNDAAFDEKEISKSSNSISSGNSIQPRVIRLRDAPAYLGMDKNRFNDEVRPYVTEVPMGSHGVAFDRLDLDAWWEDYKFRTGRSKSLLNGEKTWDKQKPELKASTPRLMDQKQLVKRGKESASSIGSGESAKTKQKPGYTTKSKGENAISSVDRALAICLQSAQRNT